MNYNRSCEYTTQVRDTPILPCVKKPLPAPHVASLPVPPLSVDQTRSTAMETASALRALASRIESVERARASAPPAEQPALDSAITGLRKQLDEGVEEYGTLVAAAGLTSSGSWPYASGTSAW